MVLSQSGVPTPATLTYVAGLTGKGHFVNNFPHVVGTPCTTLIFALTLTFALLLSCFSGTAALCQAYVEPEKLWQNPSHDDCQW